MANIKKLGQALRVVGDEIQKYESDEIDQLEILERMYQQIYQQVCVFCQRKKLCWVEEKAFTYQALAEGCNELEKWGLQKDSCFSAKFQGRCAQSSALEIALWNQMLWYRWQEEKQAKFLQDKQQIAAQLINIGEQLAKQEKTRMFFTERENYHLLVGYAASGKEDDISGDSWGVQEISGGKIVQILSDGMGSGKNANLQSTTTVRLLKILLYGGLRVETALQIINLVLASRFDGEKFSTVDLAIWDGNKNTLEFIKYGAAPSYIKNGKKVTTYGGASLPVGILAKLEGFQHSLSLQENDLLIMMSDGLYELNEPNVFQWEKIIASLPTDNPQLAAEYLLAIATSRRGKIAQDDLTVLVSRLVK